MTPRSPSRASDTSGDSPNGPIRTCVGCKRRDSRFSLVRVVLDGTEVVLDETKSKPGRGAWLHPSQECLDQALQRQALGRALRAPKAHISPSIDRDESPWSTSEYRTMSTQP